MQYYKPITTFIIFFYLIYLGQACHNNKDHFTIKHLSEKDSNTIANLFTSANRQFGENTKAAFATIDSAIELSKRINYPYGCAMGYMTIGTWYYATNNIDAAIASNDSAIKYAVGTTPQNIDLIQKTYANQAALQASMNNYKEALNLSLKMLRLAEKDSNYAHLANLYNNIGVILMNMKASSKALYYLDKGIDAAMRSSGDNAFLPNLYLNESQIFFDNNELEISKDKCEKAILLLNKKPMASNQAYAYYLLGIINLKQNKTDIAISYFNKTTHMQPPAMDMLVLAYAQLGKLSMQNGHWKPAESFYSKALQAGKLMKSPLNMAGAFADLSNLYEKEQKYRLALRYKDSFIVFQDSVQSIEKVNAINQQEVQNHLLEKDRELLNNKLTIANQHSKITRRNIFIFSISSILLFIIGGMYYFYKNKSRLESQKEEIAIWRAWSEGEEKERGRIAKELHDGIGGLLSTLKMQLESLGKRHPDILAAPVYTESQQLLNDTIEEVRQTAHNMMPEFLLKYGLTEGIAAYCNTISKDSRIKAVYQHYGALESFSNQFQLTILRIVQELVSNILKHAEATKILIQLSADNNVLILTVEDNGKGFSVHSPHSGMGLISITKRVKELNGQIHFDSVIGEGTTVNAEFNISNQSK